MIHTVPRRRPLLVVLSVLSLLTGLGATAAAVAPPAAAAVTTVSVTASPSTVLTRSTLTYRATSTAAGTVRHVTLQLPTGSTGRLTTVNGTLRTVSPGVIRWVPGSVITVRAGSRFSIPVAGVGLPDAPGPHLLALSSTATSGRTIFTGRATLTLTRPMVPTAEVVASSPFPGTTTSLTYTTTMTAPGTVSRLLITLPAGAQGRLSSSSGTLRSASAGVISWTPTFPIAVAAGQRVTAVLANVSLSVFGGAFSLPVTAYSTTGAVLSSLSASLTLIAPPAVMPAPTTQPVRPVADGCPQSWPTVAQENASVGSSDWVIPENGTGSALEAYLSATSASCGDQVTLKVSSGRPVSVTAYRMGWYAGLGGRAVWSRKDVATVQQPAFTLDASSGVTAESWTPTLTVDVTADWTPGTYLLRVSDGTLATYAPLTVRDDTGTKHDYLLQQATATWQAYNVYGGYSFYRPKAAGSAALHSDRPYAEGQGSGQFLSLEQGLVFFMESQGYDVTYWTNEDLDRLGAELPERAGTLVMPGHDEYFSTNMRSSVQHAIAAGTNVVNFGANTAYRRITYTADRRSWSIDRSGGDLSTRWMALGDAYSSQALLGAEYVCAVSAGDMTTGTSWMFDGITPGTFVPGFLAGEIDRVRPTLYQHPGLGIPLAGSATCRTSTSPSDVQVTTYSSPSGARVFNGSTFAYGCFVGGVCSPTWQVSAVPDASRRVASQVVRNVLSWASGDPAPTATTARGGALPTIRHARPALELGRE